MQPIHPITEEVCKAYYGHPVCVVMNDGTRHIGVLSCLRGGKLILNEQNVPQDDAAVNRKRKAKVKGRRRTKRAGLSAAVPGAVPAAGYGPVPGPYPVYPPYPYGPALALDIAAISLLLLLFV